MRYRKGFRRFGLGIVLTTAFLLGTPRESTAVDCYQCNDRCFDRWYTCVANCDSIEDSEERNACVYQCDLDDHNCQSYCFNYCWWI